MKRKQNEGNSGEKKGGLTCGGRSPYFNAWADADENANLMNNFLDCLDKVIRAMITIYPLDQD